MKFNPRFIGGRKMAVLLAAALVIALGAGTVLMVRHTYNRDLMAVSDNPKTQIFTVETGSPLKQIASKLEDQHLVRSAWAFQLYVRRQHLASSLQAGTYALSPSDNVQEIVRTLTKGRVTNGLITILPGRRLDQVRADFINYGFDPTEVDKALDPAQYKDLPILAIKPAGVQSLEGLLWPDSWDRDPTTPPSFIIRQSLQAMGEHLTPAVRKAFAAENLTPYQGITLASILVQEVNKPADQAKAAQVFLSRLASGSPLGSDVTVRYGAIAAGLAPDLNYDSAYNTHLHPGLPPTPISTINASALAAAAHPAATHYLYFVTGDNGITYFSTNLQDHQALTRQYCHRLCGN